MQQRFQMITNLQVKAQLVFNSSNFSPLRPSSNQARMPSSSYAGVTASQKNEHRIKNPPDNRIPTEVKDCSTQTDESALDDLISSEALIAKIKKSLRCPSTLRCPSIFVVEGSYRRRSSCSETFAAERTSTMGQTRTPPPLSAVSPLAQDPFPAAVFWGRRCQSLAGWHRDQPTSPPDAFTTRILLTRGGIHPNPGPSNLTNDYPCSVCPRLVTWAGVSFLCSQCHLWVHRRCSRLTRPSQHHSGWICPACATAIASAPTPAHAHTPAPDSMPAIDPAPAPDRVPAPGPLNALDPIPAADQIPAAVPAPQPDIRSSQYSSSTAMACSTVQWNWPTSSLCTQSSSRPSRKRNFPPPQSHAPSQATPSSGGQAWPSHRWGRPGLPHPSLSLLHPLQTPTTFSQGTLW